MRYGDARFRFSEVRSQQVSVYGPFAIGWALSLVGYFVYGGVLIAVMTALNMIGPGSVVPDEWMLMLATYGALAALYPLIALIWAPYQAVILRSIVAGIGLEAARFDLRVSTLPIWWLTVSNVFLAVISLGFLLPLVQARTTRFMVERLTSTGHVDLDAVHQTGSGPRSGEGLADAFGFSSI